MNGLFIEQRACPGCGNRRTGHNWCMGPSFCFNWRLRPDWSADAARRRAFAR
jgi:hypothetical protein